MVTEIADVTDRHGVKLVNPRFLGSPNSLEGLVIAVEDGKSVLRGKVWKRGEDEPKKWLLEAVDESPNLIGSPGLFGNAKDAEVFYDNIRVNAN